MKPKNWKRFQHFKDRRPPWVKLYRDILDDIDWHKLDGESAKFLVQLWLLASEHEEGELPEVDVIAFRFRMNPKDVNVLLSRVSAWLEQDDDSVMTERYQDDLPERETETERETESARPSTNGKRRSHRLPPDWQPTQQHISAAAERGLDVGREATKFRTHAEATGRKLESWNAGFSQWLIRAEEFTSERQKPKEKPMYRKASEVLW